MSGRSKRFRTAKRAKSSLFWIVSIALWGQRRARDALWARRRTPPFRLVTDPCDELRIIETGMNYREIITIEPDKMGGKPCIRGLRITVYDVLD